VTRAVRTKRLYAFELERFESIAVGDGLTLLRVAGRWRSRGLERLREPSVVVKDGGGERTLDLLPDPGSLPAFADVDPPPWRAGFALPGDPPRGASYMLRISDGSTFDLPQPAPAALRGRGDPRIEELEHQLECLDREHSRTEEALDLARRRLDQEIARRRAAEEELELRDLPVS
jgi:hypothetical protein